jgi:hypothetical protein
LTSRIWYKGRFCGLHCHSRCIAGLPFGFCRLPLKATALVISWHGCLRWTRWTCRIFNYWYWSYWNCRKCFPQVRRWMVGDCVSYRRLHQQNVNRFGSNTQSYQTLRATSPVLLSTSRCSQIPLELSKVLSDCARAFSGAPESSWSYGGLFRMLRNLNY